MNDMTSSFQPGTVHAGATHTYRLPQLGCLRPAGKRVWLLQQTKGPHVRSGVRTTWPPPPPLVVPELPLLLAAATSGSMAVTSVPMRHVKRVERRQRASSACADLRPFCVHACMHAARAAAGPYTA